MIGNIIVLLVIAALVAGASMKIIKNRKLGIKCSGCPYAKDGGGACSCPSVPPDK